MRDLNPGHSLSSPNIYHFATGRVRTIRRLLYFIHMFPPQAIRVCNQPYGMIHTKRAALMLLHRGHRLPNAREGNPLGYMNNHLADIFLSLTIAAPFIFSTAIF